VCAARLSRRHLLGAGAGTATLAVVDAFGLEPRWLDVTAHDVAVRGLPSNLDGFSIAQITDAHLSQLGSLEETLLAEVRRAQPELLVLTGDIVDAAPKLPLVSELCSQVRALGVPVLATLGNWEHWGKVPLDMLRATYADSGARLLVNESYDLGGAVDVVATDDSTGGEVNLRAALRNRSKAPASLLLTHSPELLDRLPDELRFDLALAGHTHGGQITLGSLAPVLPPGSGRFVAGFYDLPTGPAYVSRGTGTSLVPARFVCRPELPIFTLRRS
jgi:uncharacterized protein